MNSEKKEKRLSLDERLGLTTFNSDNVSHIAVDNEKCKSCKTKACLYVCPTKVYYLKDETIYFNYQACLETGGCIVACHVLGNKGITWKYPKGGYGVIFRYG